MNRNFFNSPLGAHVRSIEMVEDGEGGMEYATKTGVVLLQVMKKGGCFDFTRQTILTAWKYLPV